MRLDDVRYLFAYDRWATRRILGVIDGLDDATWGATGVVGDRGLGAILVHQLGAHQRWRNGLAETGLMPRPEREPLPEPGAVARAWADEWDALDAWLATLTDEWLLQTDEGCPVLADARARGEPRDAAPVEAAVILTDAGRSPGDLDMIFFAEELARPAS